MMISPSATLSCGTRLQVSTGGFDANTAIRNAIKELTRQGLTTVDYASGRTMSVEAAVRMNVVTGVNQTALRLQDTLADEMDSDLVETTAHSGARPSHARWQGQVFSRSGKSKKYPDFRRATGYGTGPGLAALTLPPNGWDGRTCSIARLTSGAKRYCGFISQKAFNMTILQELISLRGEGRFTYYFERNISTNKQRFYILIILYLKSLLIGGNISFEIVGD